MSVSEVMTFKYFFIYKL